MSNNLTVAGASALAQILAEPDRLKEIPVETVERLFALDREFRADRARSEFAAAFNAVQGEMSPVRRAAKNSQTASFYARAEHVAGMLDPIITRHGFSRSFSTEDCPLADHMRFVLTIRHVGGHVEQHRLDAPIDNVGPKGNPTKTRLHGMASSYTYCERHLLCKVFGVQLVDDDDGNAAAMGPASANASDADIAEVNRLLDATATDKRKFCSHFNIAAVPELTAAQARQALVLLRKKEMENA